MITGKLDTPDFSGNHRISGLDWQEMSAKTQEQMSKKLVKDIDSLRSIKGSQQLQIDDLEAANRKWQVISACLGTLSFMLILFIVLGVK